MRRAAILSLVVVVVGLSTVNVFARGQSEPEPTHPVEATGQSQPTQTDAAAQAGRAARYSGVAGRITVYLSGPTSMIDRLEQVFEQQHGDVLDFVQMGCGPLRQRVWTELESGEILADVFWGSDPLVYNALDDRGALDPFVPEDFDALRPEYRVNRNYTLVSERYGVIIYNSDVLSGDQVPASYADLAESDLNGRITHADPTQSSTALALVAGLYEISGNAWHLETGMRDNGLFLMRRNGDVPMKIQEGEFDAGIAPHDAVIRLRKKAQKEGYPLPLSMAWPAEGAIAIQRPVAISRNEARPAVNQEIAEDFVRFLISEPTQRMLLNFGFVSVREGLPMPQGAPQNPNVYRVDWETLSDNQERIAREFAELFE